MIHRNFQGSTARNPRSRPDTGTMRARPIRISRVRSLGRADFEVLGAKVTLLVSEPGVIARAVQAVRRELTPLEVTDPAARAGAADRLVAAAAAAADGGALLNIDGDIATAGPVPVEGWRIRLADGRSARDDVIHLGAGGLATVRSAGKGSIWRTVTVAASSCREARMAAQSLVARGEAAVRGLAPTGPGSGLAARLARVDGSVVRTGRWAAGPAAA